MVICIYCPVNRNKRVRDRGQVKVVNISRMNISYKAMLGCSRLLAVHISVCTTFHTHVYGFAVFSITTFAPLKSNMHPCIYKCKNK